MALLPAALAATSIGAVALVGGLVVSDHEPSSATSDTVASISVAYTDTVPPSATDATSSRLGWRWFSRLDPAQRACLGKANLSRPVGPLTPAQKATIQEQLRTAATGCGIPIPSGERRAALTAWWNALTPTQQSCLKKADLTRPIGILTADQRRTLKEEVVAAAKSCGVALPKAGDGATNPAVTPSPAGSPTT